MKKIIIIGASSGIGYGLAEALASRGIRVGLGARHTSKLKSLKEKYPGSVEYESIDVTHHDAGKKLLELIGKTGGMDIYIHVAGIGYDNPGLDPEREVDMVATNAMGFARMISNAYRYFRDNKLKGQIAAVTSVAGTKGIGAMSAYSASKKFGQCYLDAMRQLSVEEDADVCFTDIRPGWIATPLIPEGKEFPMEMDLQYAIPLIIKAIVRKKRIAVIDWRWNLLVGAWNCIPNAIWTRMKVRTFLGI